MGAGLVLGALTVPTAAQATGLNVEKLRLRPYEDGFSASVDLSVAYGQGNVTFFDLGTEGSFAFRHDRHLVFLIGASRFNTITRNADGEGVQQLFDGDSRFLNRHHAHLRYNYRFLDWLSAEVFTQVQSDEFLLVQVRTKHGLGPRFTPYGSDQFGVHIGTDYMFDHEQLDARKLLVAPRGRSTSYSHRLSSYLTLMLEIDRFAAQTTTYYQPRFDDWRDFQIIHETEFAIDITEHFAFKLAMNLRWDSNPPVYCAEEVDAGGVCTAEDVVEVRTYDLAFRNAFSFSF